MTPWKPGRGRRPYNMLYMSLPNNGSMGVGGNGADQEVE